MSRFMFRRTAQTGNLLYGKISPDSNDGNYLKTLETGCHILHFCYDKEYHRLILYTYDEMQFGYLDLEGII